MRSAFLSFLKKLFLKVVSDEGAILVLRGLLKGKKWIIRSGVAGYWWGSYEPAIQRLFRRIVKPGDTVFDVGAHVGFYSLIAALLVDAHGRVVAFEPVARNADYLRRHLALNKITNVKVVAAAVSERSGESDFDAGPDSFTGKLVPGVSKSAAKVATISLDDFIDHEGRRLLPNFIKMDVEGAEASVLKGAKRTLEQVRPTIMVATHSPSLHKEVAKILESHHYRVEPIGSEGEGVIGYPI